MLPGRALPIGTLFSVSAHDTSSNRSPRADQQTAGWLPSAGREYLYALLSVCVVATVRGALNPVLAPISPFLIFVLPTVVMAMRGEPGPSLLASGLSAVLAVRFFVQPSDPQWWSSAAQLTRLSVFVVENLAIVALGFRRRQQRDRALHAGQVQAVHATIRTVQHLVADSLNQLQILRIDAEGLVPQQSVELFDRTIQQMAAELRAIADLDTYAETPMAMGIGLVVDNSRTPREPY